MFGENMSLLNIFLTEILRPLLGAARTKFDVRQEENLYEVSRY